MEARNVIKGPVITERSAELTELGKYTFDVDVKATKTDIKKAVEEIFDVKVAKVNVTNYGGKLKRMGRYEGYTNRKRKAIVTLTEDSDEINFF